MTSILRRFIDAGVPPEMPPEEAKYVRMGNLGSLLMIAVNVPYMALCVVNGWSAILLELGALNTLLLLTALFNRLGWRAFALFYFGTLLNAHLVFVTVAMGQEALLQLLIFFTAGGVITLLPRGNKALMVGGLIGIFATYEVALALSGAHGPLVRLDPEQVRNLRTFVLYTVFVLIVVNALIGRVGAIQAEDRLLAEKQKSESLLQQVQEHDRQRTLFFQNVSHELRTPLTLILGPLESLRAEAEAPEAAAFRSRLEMVMRNARRLLRMINQLLDLSKIDAGRVTAEKRRGDLGAFVAELACSFAPYAEKLGVALRVKRGGGDLHADFDEELVEKIVSNLLSNACKFTPSGGEIVVEIAETIERGGVRIGVKDTGVGIPPESLPRVFERFYQVDGSASRRREGTGIGLSLVKELVDLHGGGISVNSAPSGGTEFVVTLPRGLAPTAPDAATREAEGVHAFAYAQLESSGLESVAAVARDVAGGTRLAGRPTILIVDDNADMRDYVRRGIEPYYRVVEAAEGLEALQLAREATPDLVVSDVMMPGMDGYALCRALLADPQTSRAPVILLTAKAAREMVVEGLEAGAVDYVTKPFSFDVLLAKIKGVLQRKAEQDRLALRDGLTGVFNRAAWEQTAGRELRKIAACGGVASVAFLDLDDFKEVNDRFGHSTGDAALVELAGTLTCELRATDLVGRYGGEEFVVFLPGSTPEDAARSCERILELFRTNGAANHGARCAFSAGVAEVDASAATRLDEYVARADAAMYEAKRAGKGRVVVWGAARDGGAGERA